AARAQAAAIAARHHLRLRHPRPGRGALDERPHRRHARRTHRAARRRRHDLRTPGIRLRRRLRRAAELLRRRRLARRRRRRHPARPAAPRHTARRARRGRRRPRGRAPRVHRALRRPSERQRQHRLRRRHRRLAPRRDAAVPRATRRPHRRAVTPPHPGCAHPRRGGSRLGQLARRRRAGLPRRGHRRPQRLRAAADRRNPPGPRTRDRGSRRGRRRTLTERTTTMTANNDVRILTSRAAAPLVRRELSRRGFLAVAGGVGTTMMLAACTTPGGSPAPVATGGELENALSIYTWGDYDDPGVLENFTAELGPRITLDSYGSNEEMIAKLVAAKGTSGYDIIIPTGVFIPQLVENGLLYKLNRDLIPNIEHVDPAYLGRVWDPKNEYSICKAWGTTGFVYDKTVITRELKTWNDFFDAAKNEASG